MARRGMSAYIAPSTRNGPLAEHAGETLFEWITRNNSPRKPKTPPVLAMAAAAAKKKAPASSGNSSKGAIPEGTN